MYTCIIIVRSAQHPLDDVQLSLTTEDDPMLPYYVQGILAEYFNTTCCDRPPTPEQVHAEYSQLLPTLIELLATIVTSQISSTC